MRDDEQVDLATLHQRDRSIGVSLAGLRDGSGAQILAWAKARGIDDATGDRAEARVSALIWIAGLVLGIAAAAGALYFEGGARVNVVALLAILVGLQLVSVVLSVLGMLPARVRAAVPGLSAINDALAVLSPSRAAVSAARRFAPAFAETFDALSAGTERDARLFARIRRWTLWCWSQGFAVAFNIGLTACVLALVIFTDLAFGWSTTLDVSASSVHELARTIALPWRELVPDAVPSLELVEISRYFRAASSTRVDPMLLGGWWRFVLACLLVYALFPRVALLLLARWRRGRAIAWTLNHLPGAPELLYRLNNERVTTRAEGAPESSVPGPQDEARLSFAPSSGPCSLVLWGIEDLPGAAVDRQVRAATGLDPIERRGAGGASSIEQDQAVVDALAGSATPLVVVVKAWEPPLAELADFLDDVRGASAEARALIVVPIASDGGRASDDDVSIWRERLARIGDPWLSVRAAAAGEGS